MALNVKFEVTSNNVEVKSGTNGRGPWQIREQEAFMFRGDDKYPEKVVVTLDDNAQPYQPGFYELDEKSLYAGKYNQLQIRPRLRPLVTAAARQQANG